MKLTNYVNAILDVAKANNVDWTTGVHMFMNNIHDAGDPTDLYHYIGADYVDYKALKTEVDKMTHREVANMIDETIDYIRTNADKIFADR